MSKQQNKIIYSRRIMEKLVEMGNIPISQMKNPSRPEFYCWIFAVGDKFQRDFDALQRGGAADDQ